MLDAWTATMHLLLASLETRFEYVESDANWSDGASRLLGADPWAQANGFAFKQVLYHHGRGWRRATIESSMSSRCSLQIRGATVAKDRNYGGMRGTRVRVPRCTRILPLDISKGPRREEHDV